MFPSWSRKVLLRTLILICMCALILGGVYQVSGNLSQDAEQAAQNQVPATGQGSIAFDDAIKPPKDGARARQMLPEGPKDPKRITLVEAITLVEQAGKGEVVKAEKVIDGDKIQFNLEVAAKNKAKVLFNLDATGSVILEAPAPAPKAAKKKNK